MVKLSNPLEDPKTRHPIDNLNLPFSDYIKQCRHLIETTRLDLDIHPEKTILANCPFELRPDQAGTTGALLIHGLLDSPFIMQDIGRRLQTKGLLVRSLLLPGHGTVPGDLLSVDYKNWIQALHYGIASLKKEVEKIYLVGFSTGASLALHHVLHHHDIAGVIAISPAIKIRSRLDFSCNWYKTLSWFWERAKWLHIEPENDYAKYQSIPFNAAYQVYKLTRLLKKQSKTKVASCPVFFALSLADSTVSARASIKYFQRYLRPQNRMLLYSNKNKHHQDLNTLVRKSAFPELHIHDLSHIAPPISPNNPHYGKQGDYLYASHSNAENMVYGAFNRLENKIYNFLYNAKLTQLQRRRVTFNPDFEFFMNEIENFMDL